MRYEAIRVLPEGVSVKKHSGIVFLTSRAGMYAEATENPNAYPGDLQVEVVYEAAVEAQALLKERDRAVELLHRAMKSVLMVEAERAQSPFSISTVARNIPTLAEEIMAFLKESS